MSAAVFVDTNVLVYVRDATEPVKGARAKEWMELLWQERAGRLSFQVLHEFYVTTTKKLKPGLTRDEARTEVQLLLSWLPVPMNEPVLLAAWRLQDMYELSWWDSLIVAAAKLQGCIYLLSEDLQDNQLLDGVRVINPFRLLPSKDILHEDLSHSGVEP